MLEPDDDIVEEDKAELSKGLVVTETTPSLDCVILCVAIAAKIFLRNAWHTRLLPIILPHTAKWIKECVCQLI